MKMLKCGRPLAMTRAIPRLWMRAMRKTLTVAGILQTLVFEDDVSDADCELHLVGSDPIA